MKSSQYLFLPIIGIFFILDQIFKYLIRTNPSFSVDIIEHIVRVEYFANPGIAFGIPIPNSALIIATPIILIGLIALLCTRWERASFAYRAGLLLIITGAISNLIDRVLFEVTIDYIRIFTGVVNLADGLIVAGVLLFLFSERKKKQEEEEKPLFP